MMKDDDFKLLRGFADRQTDERTARQTNERTNEQTLVIVESLSRLKRGNTPSNVNLNVLCLYMNIIGRIGVG